MTQSATDHRTEPQPASLIRPEDIAQMVRDLFSTMLGIPIDTTPRPPATPDDTWLQAAVHIRGDWQAEVRVLAPRGLAIRISSAMFQSEPNELSDEDTEDAIGEIANVIGGNAKGIVDRDCTLSIPVVGSVEQTVPENAVSVHIDVDGCTLSVVLIEI